jgi:hypothetical protein
MTSSTPNVLVRYAGGGAGIVSGSGSPGQIAFWSGSSILSGDNNLFWDNTNKRLGIGTTTPQTALHVIGDITATNFIGNYAGTISSANVSSGVFGSLTGGGNFSFPAFLGISTSSQLNLPQPLSVYGNAYIEGNIGIGTTTPTAKLYIRTTDTTTVPFQVNALVQPLVGWSYRRPITIDNTANSNNLTDYQVLVTLDTASLITAGKMRSDCGDIRFTDSNGTTLLNYWIESGCNTASTKIWVKVPSIPANSTKAIYVYYGNPSATSLSSGDATFLFFDDFEGTSLDTTKWTTTGYGGYGGIYYSVSGSILTEWSDGRWRILRMNRNFAPSDTIAVEAKFLKTADSSWHPHNLVQYNNVDNNTLGLSDPAYAGANIGVYFRVSGGPYTYPKDFGPISSNVWYISRIIKKSSTTLYIDVLTSNRTFIDSYETTQSAWSTVTWTWVNWQYENIQVKYDWIFVRKYASPEPTTSVGAEESSLRQQTVFSIEPGSGAVKAQMVSWTGMGMAVWDRAGTYSWIVPAGVYRVRAIVTGGGGGGGGGVTYYVASGGGGGATVFVTFDVNPGEILTISVGAGGLGGSPGSNGLNGSPSRILRGSNIIVEASGGEGGQKFYPYGGYGGRGGTSFILGEGATGFLVMGGAGQPGRYLGSSVNPGADGNGGGTFWGPGSPTTFFSYDQGAPGSGGGGGHDSSNAGRKGKDGIVVIFY